jgi:hypothetical protein
MPLVETLDAREVLFRDHQGGRRRHGGRVERSPERAQEEKRHDVRDVRDSRGEEPGEQERRRRHEPVGRQHHGLAVPAIDQRADHRSENDR